MTVNRFYYSVCGGRVSDDIKAVYILGCAILMLMDHWVFTWNLCVCMLMQLSDGFVCVALWAFWLHVCLQPGINLCDACM